MIRQQGPVARLDNPYLQILFECRSRSRAIGHLPFLATLAAHPNPLLASIEILQIEPHGAIGSTLGAIVLGWTYDAMPRSGRGAFAVAPLMPLWLLFCLVINGLGALMDRQLWPTKNRCLSHRPASTL